ncbi:hypothetical protein MMB17_17200 [Methylobacterium organophilum]|uniref:hypothetical protein n=1 Tax=Methylobacterium organophilum TaxID=410 RepID=UPI001F141268|nr:hypothetical protein [Methylobacterium organophilum]UMY16428.1 hypothetical protein MMB17_17200 [Methylobacterium organophilum]
MSTTRLARLALAAALSAGLPATAALAQSYTAPAGIPTQTAPGSTVETGRGRALPTLLPNRGDDLSTGSVNRRHRSEERNPRR